jgi:hypothetical protein
MTHSQPPRWYRYRKHLPPGPNIKTWKQLVKASGEGARVGYYHQQLVGQVQALETEALENGRLLSDDGITRYFWHEFDQVIGAALGEETRFLLVEQHVTGDFHGHPVLWSELKRKGAKDEDRRNQ